MTLWDTVVNALTKLGNYIGLSTRQQRDSRDAVLRDLTAFQSLVTKLCGGKTSSPDLTEAFFKEVAVAKEAARRTLDEHSERGGKRWHHDADWVLRAGERAVDRYYHAYMHPGPSPGPAMEKAHQDYQRFEDLFRKVRG